MDMAAAAHVVSVDLGGTHTRVALVTPDGRIVRREIRPTQTMEDHPGRLVELIVAVAEDSGAAMAVIGVPGRVDHLRGRLEWAPNLPVHWARHLSQDELADKVGMPVALANDADLAAVGEHRFGAGRETMDMVYLTMSTGVGCGVILNGKLAHGRRSLAEVGHTTIDRHATDAARTLEGAASGTAMNRLAEHAGLPLRGRDLVEAVRRGDDAALKIWADVAAAAALGVANLAHLYSPEAVVIGGGLGLNQDLLHEPVRAALETYGPRDLPEPIRVVRAELGDDAGLAGAAGWADAFVPSPAPMSSNA
jgi:glucokinase